MTNHTLKDVLLDNAAVGRVWGWETGALDFPVGCDIALVIVGESGHCQADKALNTFPWWVFDEQLMPPFLWPLRCIQKDIF